MKSAPIHNLVRKSGSVLTYSVLTRVEIWVSYSIKLLHPLVGSSENKKKDNKRKEKGEDVIFPRFVSNGKWKEKINRKKKKKKDGTHAKVLSTRMMKKEKENLLHWLNRKDNLLTKSFRKNDIINPKKL